MKNTIWLKNWATDWIFHRRLWCHSKLPQINTYIMLAKCAIIVQISQLNVSWTSLLICGICNYLKIYMYSIDHLFLFSFSSHEKVKLVSDKFLWIASANDGVKQYRCRLTLSNSLQFPESTVLVRVMPFDFIKTEVIFVAIFTGQL